MNFVKLRKVWSNLGFRLRLVIALSSVLALVLIIGYWAIFMEFQAELQSEFDRSLYNYATDLLENVQLTPGGEADLPFHVIFSAEKVFPFPHGDALVKIYRHPFYELFSFSSDQQAPTDFNFLRNEILRNRDNAFYDLTAANGDRWRGVLIQVDESPVPSIYFFVAVPRDTLTSHELKFKSIFIAGQLVTFLISAFLISILSRSMLKSLEKLTSSIDYIPLTENEFEVPEGPPEVTLLANLLNKLLLQVRKTLSAHQEFVAQAAHQLKTPLTIAKGHLEQIVNVSHEGDKIQDPNHLKMVLEEIDFMSSTISNLLNLVQIESGFQNLKISKVGLLDQILLSVDHLEYIARKKSVKFQVHCEDSTEAETEWMIHTDPQLFSIILNNVLENAVKYASVSPIEVNVFSVMDAFKITVTNHCHMEYDESMLTSLKEKFVRGLTLESGQGLGLYIAMKIAEALQIDLKVGFKQGLFRVELSIPKKP